MHRIRLDGEKCVTPVLRPSRLSDWPSYRTNEIKEKIVHIIPHNKLPRHSPARIVAESVNLGSVSNLTKVLTAKSNWDSLELICPSTGDSIIYIYIYIYIYMYTYLYIYIYIYIYVYIYILNRRRLRDSFFYKFIALYM